MIDKGLILVSSSSVYIQVDHTTMVANNSTVTGIVVMSRSACLLLVYIMQSAQIL